MSIDSQVMDYVGELNMIKIKYLFEIRRLIAPVFICPSLGILLVLLLYWFIFTKVRTYTHFDNWILHGKIIQSVPFNDCMFDIEVIFFLKMLINF
jgi:hypothetical protein